MGTNRAVVGWIKTTIPANNNKSATNPTIFEILPLKTDLFAKKIFKFSFAFYKNLELICIK